MVVRDCNAVRIERSRQLLGALRLLQVERKKRESDRKNNGKIRRATRSENRNKYQRREVQILGFPTSRETRLG